ncbi:MAG: glycerol-3-phosphate 1-O-acyltransferase PlsY [Peptoniphilaceae bacterium]|nr:glycerol-3-phosphate 1-O-acyltransferase PlsY [Peptoniphilaceae bacterium]
MKYALIVFLSYLIGSLPFAYIFGKIFTGKDIRKLGSGNSGSTNALRSFGVAIGGLTFLCDFGKGILVIFLAKALSPGNHWAIAAAMLSVVIGHCYSIFLGFRGGKGVATTAALLFLLDWRLFLVVILCFLVIVASTKFVSLGSILCSLLGGTAALFFLRQQFPVGPALFLCAILIVFRHRENIQRLLHGKESKIGIGKSGKPKRRQKAEIRPKEAVRNIVSEEAEENRNTQIPRKKSAKKKKNRFFLIIWILACFGIFTVFATRYAFASPKIILSKPEEHIIQEKGRGVFYFQEYAPAIFLGESFSSSEIHTEERYRVNSELADLSEEQLARISNENMRLQHWKEKEDISKDLSFLRNKAYLEMLLQTKKLIMPFSGMISFQLDGLESLYRVENLAMLLPEDIETNFKQTPMQGIKFIDNRRFFLALSLPSKSRESEYGIGREYVLHIDEDAVLKGKLNSIKTDEHGKKLLVFSFDDGFQLIRNKRFADVTLDVQKAASYSLPIAAVMREKKKYYCYVVNRSNTAVKTQVFPIDSDLEQGIFYIAATPPKEDTDSKSRKIKQFDEVLKKPEGVQEGDHIR